MMNILYGTKWACPLCASPHNCLCNLPLCSNRILAERFSHYRKRQVSYNVKKSVLRHSPTALRQPAIPASLTLFLSTARCSATLVTPPIGFLNYSISISSRGQITFVATSKSSSSIVHSSRSGSAESSLPVIPSKAPFSTLT